ncbi:MAG TPA: SulP family inorganic anion transporter, partial [Ignavibacteriaceae bacterium]|nr:SulP family inorganic anion transporter [Ignavibacteriaceae bacterium]
AVYYLKLPVETIGTKFGEISSSLPHLTLYDINFKIIRNLIAPATVIALLAAIESLLSAVVADGMIGGKHRSNMELIAQGAANIITPLFGGIPATGAIARTATNIKNGGRTPVAGIVHSVTLFLIMIFFGSMASLIPMATLAAILVMVAYNMSEWRAFRQLLKAPKSDIIVLLTTFFLTVIFDLTLALEIGIILSVLLFMKRMAEVSNINILTRELADEEEKPDTNSIDRKQIPEGVEVFEINGPFFFGAASKFESQMQIVESPPKVRILRMRNVPAIDATGLNTIKSIYNHSKKMNTALILSGVHTQPLYAMTQSGIIKLFGYENIFGNIDDALDRSRELLGLPKIGRPKDFIPSVKREIENNN